MIFYFGKLQVITKSYGITAQRKMWMKSEAFLGKIDWLQNDHKNFEYFPFQLDNNTLSSVEVHLIKKE